MESYSTEVPSYSLSTIYSYDTASLKDSNLENSPEVSSVVKKLTSLSVSRTDIQVEGKHEYFLDEDTAEGYYIPHQLEFPDLIALRSDNNPIFFDGEDSMFNLLLGITDSLGANSTGTSQNEYRRRLSDDFEDVEVSSATSMSSVLGITDSLGSNSTRTSQTGCRRRLSDDFEDVEVSSVTSMSSVLGRVLNLDFDDQFDAADDLKTAKIDITGLQNCEVDNIYEIQLAEYEKCLQGLVSESERSHYEAKLRNSGFSTKLSLPCSDSSQSQDVGSFNTEFVCQINSREELCFKGKKFTVSGNAKELNGEATGELDTRTSYMVSVDNPTVDHNFPNSTKKCQFTAINHFSSTRQPLANVGEKGHETFVWLKL
ncbi:mitogen-activated protein kinase kinase kinase [Sarracenia purpurea var. burkii]